MLLTGEWAAFFWVRVVWWRVQSSTEMHLRTTEGGRRDDFRRRNSRASPTSTLLPCSLLLRQCSTWLHDCSIASTLDK